jgi:hypothetical protein
MPLISTKIIDYLISNHIESKEDITVVSTTISSPTGYGRIVRGQNGRLEAIVEEKDADPAVKLITEINTGLYCVKTKVLKELLCKLKPNNAQKEYQGKEVATWEYWEGTDKYSGETYRHNGPKPKDNGVIWKPVSKAYYFGWKMGITCNFNGILIDASSGLTDEDREWLASQEAIDAIAHGQLWAEIRSMMVASLGGLRHPVIHKLRILDEAMRDGLEVK